MIFCEVSNGEGLLCTDNPEVVCVDALMGGNLLCLFIAARLLSTRKQAVTAVARARVDSCSRKEVLAFHLSIS